MKRLLLLLAVAPLLAQTPASPMLQTGMNSSVVQVAVSSGPRQSVVASGVITADGKTILTDAGILANAREITIAYADGELADAVFGGVQQRNHIALIPVPAAHGKVAALSPLAEGVLDGPEIAGTVGGAPEAFDVAQRAVRARPVGTGAALRWQITPAPPEYARGGPLFDSQGLLVAVIVLEGETLVGMPAGLAFKVEPVIPADTVLYKEAALPPVKVEVKAPPAAETASKKPAKKAKATAAKTAEVKNGAVKASASTTPPSVSPSLPPSPPPPNIPNLNLPLRSVRMEWARKLPAPLSTPAPERAEAKSSPAVVPVSKKPATAVAKNVPPSPQPTAVAATPAASFDIHDVLQTAEDFTKKKEYVKAIDTLEEAIQKHPEANQLYFQLGLAYWNKAALKPDGTPRSTMEKSPYHKSVKAFETFLQKAPNDKLAVEARNRLDTLRKLQYGYTR